MQPFRTALEGAVAFGSTHKAELAAAVAWLASLPMPSPYHQLATLAAAALAALAGTKYSSPAGS